MHKSVKKIVVKTSFRPFIFYVQHIKPHGVRGLSKNYHMRFDPKLVHGICAICQIPCVCYECTYMLDKPWIHGLTPPQQQQPRYQPVIDFT